MILGNVSLSIIANGILNELYKYGTASEWQKSEVFAFATSSWLMMKDKKMNSIDTIKVLQQPINLHLV